MPKIKKKYMIDCGELVHSIQIERKTITTIKGIVEETWKVIYKPRCAVNNNTGSEYLKNGIELYDKISKKFTFRTNRNVEIKPSDRILYDGNYYNVTSIYDYDDNGIYTIAIAVRSE